MAEVPKACLTALPELKNTTDDAVAPILNSHKFKQTHMLTDVRLALGFLGVAIAAGTFYHDYTVGFDAAKPVTLVAVVAYFIINSLLTLWMWQVEKGTVYEGVGPGGEKVRVMSWSKKWEPVWYYKIAVTEGGKESVVKGEQPFTRWFNDKGEVVREKLEELLLSEIRKKKQ